MAKNKKIAMSLAAARVIEECNKKEKSTKKNNKNKTKKKGK